MERYQTISELQLKTDAPVVMTDNQGFVTYVNACFTAVFGWSAEEITGQNITVIIPNGFHAPHHLFLPLSLDAEVNDSQSSDPA